MSDFPSRAPQWSRSAELASSLWFALDSAHRFIILQRWGLDKVCELEFTFLRKHQETHFLEGLKKLGLEDEPDHEKAAKYHVLSNVLGGLDMGYRSDDQGRAWVFYFPPSAFGASPLHPGPGICAVPSDTFLAGLRGWHANNGVLLGNDRLRFTITQLMSEGGPYDAGFFDVAESPLSEDGRLRVSLGLGEEVLPGPIPDLGPATWPQARKDKALQKYCAQYAIGGLAQIAEFTDLQEAAIIIEQSVASVFSSWARQLMHEFALYDDNPVLQMARLFQTCHEFIGDDFETLGTGSEVVLLHKNTRLSVPEYDGWALPPHQILEAMGRGWSSVSRTVGPTVRVAPQPTSSNQVAWTFSAQ
ncbi:MAG TPA: hypothetical protein VIQ76_16645 [Propionibacteriaceae bacterium]|jgi:hypothetical protein